MDVAHRLQGDLVGEGHIELAGDKRERLGRPVRDDRPLDAVEVGRAAEAIETAENIRVRDHAGAA